jgi:hypothetical protein
MLLVVGCQLLMKNDGKRHIHFDTSLIEIKGYCDEKAMKRKRRGMGGLFEG